MNILGLLPGLKVGAAALAVGVAVGGYGGCTWKQRQWDADVARQQIAAAKVVTVQRNDTAKVETVYVDKLKVVPQLTADLVSRCVGVRNYATDRTRMSESTGVADTPRGTDADTRQFCTELAESFAAGLRNSARLDACSGWIVANGGAKD